MKEDFSLFDYEDKNCSTISDIANIFQQHKNTFLDSETKLLSKEMNDKIVGEYKKGFKLPNFPNYETFYKIMREEIKEVESPS